MTQQPEYPSNRFLDLLETCFKTLNERLKFLSYGASFVFLLGSPSYAQMKLPQPEVKSPESCHVPTSLIRFNAATPRFSESVLNKTDLKIIALGSSSTQGAGAASIHASYPSILQTELRLRWPDRKIDVLNKGIGGDLTSDMLNRLERDVLSHNPALVIWQTGVNDAMRKVNPDLFRSQLLTGIEKMRAKNIDIVMLDQQYSPQTEQADKDNIYLEIVRDVSQQQHLALLSRYQIMKHLVTSSQYTIRDLLSPDQFHMNERSYKCLGLLLADALYHAGHLKTEPQPELKSRQDTSHLSY